MSEITPSQMAGPERSDQILHPEEHKRLDEIFGPNTPERKAAEGFLGQKTGPARRIDGYRAHTDLFSSRRDKLLEEQFKEAIRRRMSGDNSDDNQPKPID